jgi:DNA-damage-inducible protein D
LSDSENALSPLADSPFERIKQIDGDDIEFWSARDLMPILEYTKWQNFKTVLPKAQIACENSGIDPSDHFTGSGKMVAIGSDAKREVEDMHLSRYACYLIVQNADPAKEVVALGQTYFAVQTRRQELAEADAMAELTEDQRRLLLRQRIKVQNTDLASAAKNAGVVTALDFAVFQNHGYRGLYNGLSAEDIHKRKKLKKSQHILDHMGTTELAANLFRSTQAEEKLRRDHVQGKDAANGVHYQAGIVVRRAIAELGGTMPEDLPTVERSKSWNEPRRNALLLPKADIKRMPTPRTSCELTFLSIGHRPLLTKILRNMDDASRLPTGYPGLKQIRGFVASLANFGREQIAFFIDTCSLISGVERFTRNESG